MRASLALLFVSAGAGSAFAQYTYEMRLIADGQAGSPGGANAAQTYNIGSGSSQPTRIGFWLQARVLQTTGQNWGITRVSSNLADPAFIRIDDPAGLASISRGSVNASGTLFGRGAGYRNGGANSGNTGNTAASVPFPGGNGNENGGLDNGGSGALMTRIYSFESYVGALRFDSDGDSDGDGLYENPWGVNGALLSPGVTGFPIANGVFSPWANVYRFWVSLGDASIGREVTLNASAFVQGALESGPTSPGGFNFAMILAPGQAMTASFTFSLPTPGAAAVLAMGGLAAARRRR